LRELGSPYGAIHVGKELLKQEIIFAKVHVDYAHMTTVLILDKCV